MAKKQYVQAKKDIEALLHENGDSEICAEVPGHLSVWEEAFTVENYYDEVQNKYTERTLKVQNSLNNGIDLAVIIAESINTPDFFNYLLGEVKIEGNIKTYTKPHVSSDKKYFNFSQKNKKKYFTDKLLLALINVAPKGSQAHKVRNECKELMVLSFGGIPVDRNVQSCDMNCSHINNFKNLEKLEIEKPKNLINSSELKKLTKLNHLSIAGNFVKKELLITEDLPVLENLKSIHISITTNKDLSFLKNIKSLQNISLKRSSLQNLTGLDVSEAIDLKILECNQLTDASILKEATKVKNVDLESYEDGEKVLEISFIESFINTERLSVTGYDWSNLKDLSALKNMKYLCISNPINLNNFPELGENNNLKELYISDTKLTELNGISLCSKLKTLSLRDNKNLNTVESLPNLKFIDVALAENGFKNLDFLENTQIISKFNYSLGYNKDLDVREGAFNVSYDRSDEDKKKTGKGLPDGFDSNGHVIPIFYEDGSSSNDLDDNIFYLNDCENLENIKGLKNVTNIMSLDLTNCLKIKSLEGIEKMLDLREINLKDCTSLESIHALKSCSKLEKILAFGCNKISPKPKVKNMDTLEKVQEYLALL